MSSSQSSREHFRVFRENYKKGMLDDGQGTPPAAQQTAPTPLTSKRRRGYLRDYVRRLRPHRYAIVILFLLALVSTILQMAEPLFMRFIIDHVLLNSALDVPGRLMALNFAGVVYLLVILLAAALGLVRDYRQRVLNVRVVLTLRRSLFRKLLRQPMSVLWNMKTGGVLSRLTGDIDSTTELLQSAIVSPAMSVSRLVIAVAILVSLNWQLALVALAMIPGAVLISVTVARRVRPIYREIRGDAERVDGRVGETFSGIRVVRAFGREAREQLNYVRSRHGIARKLLFAQRRELVLWASWGFLVSSVSVVIVWYGGHLYVKGVASIGDITAFQWYSLLLLQPVWQLVSSFSDLQRSLAAMERVFEVLRMAGDKPDRPDAMDAPHVVREIKFDNVDFEYQDGHPILQDFNVCVRAGMVVALVGRSGSGKTTVTDLLARFQDPTRGRVLLNGTDIRDFRIRTYRDLLALVQQDVFLFDGTVRDNIAYGTRGATEEEVEAAARRANAHEFIVNLPEGYRTFVGERGVKLSGGQQQRLAIARAVLADPQILILDEATSNLDTESEQQIQASMSTLLKGRTTFMVAHRLSTIRHADLILLLENGRIVERGTHDALMDARGSYHEMVVRQMEFGSEPVAEAVV